MPTVYTIPPGVSFVDALAHGLLRRAGGDPLALSRQTVLLPTRRACRALQEAFLRASDRRSLLLPRLLPLGDLDAEELLLAGDEGTVGAADDGVLAPAMPSLKRQLLLSQLVARAAEARGSPIGEDQAVRLAGELARLLDQVETEGLGFDGLETLVPEEYAVHWQETITFLEVLTKAWPAIQETQGCIGPAERRRRLLEAQADAWRRTPPSDPVIAAGSTGSIPATADLLAVVAGLARGMVVLPGLDGEADDESWEAIREDPGHPQHGLARLLDRIGLDRGVVPIWPEHGVAQTPPVRARFVNAALAPAAVTSGWGDFLDACDAGDLRRALNDVTRIDCPNPGVEATVIALVLRRVLDEEGCRAALVTPDRGLARRVAAILGRWGVTVDDSAGTPLSDTPPGTFLRLTAEMIAGGLAPLPTLAALKHPLAAGGRSPGAFRAHVRALEMATLRGPRPAPGFAGLKQAVRAAGGGDHLRRWLAGIEGIAKPFVRALAKRRPLAEVVDAHVAFAEALAASAEDTGAARLWQGEAGAAAADFVADLREAAPDAPPMTGERYPAVLADLLAGHVVRPRYGSHPRLSIWGPLEARLQHVDVLVLGGLNEGTWPAAVDPGPWLSRPMRAEFGLPPPERRIGLAAHDFAQAFCAPRVTLTRATRVEGAPTVPSRWLLRLDALLQATDPPLRLDGAAAQWLGWAEALDRPAEWLRAAPPAPTPPLAARPRELSVTGIETWMRDPYDLYARQILGLKALDLIDADPGAAELGTMVHKALERFVAAYPARLPDDPEAELIAIGRDVFERYAVKPGVFAFWWPRFLRIAGWVAEVERTRRASVDRILGEVTGTLGLDAPGGPFNASAKADRIDVLRDGTFAILDYKTGALPSDKEIENGWALQLPLEAAIAGAGGFDGLPEGAPERLEYWRLSGGEPVGEARPVKGDPVARADQALAQLRRWVARFDEVKTPYVARPWPARVHRFSDYAHLARVKEWAAGGSGEDGG